MSRQKAQHFCYNKILWVEGHLGNELVRARQIHILYIYILMLYIMCVKYGETL